MSNESSPKPRFKVGDKLVYLPDKRGISDEPHDLVEPLIVTKIDADSFGISYRVDDSDGSDDWWLEESQVTLQSESTPPWISFETRKPTKEDADEHGLVIHGGGSCAPCSVEWSQSPIRICTHWMPLTPVPKPRILTRDELDLKEAEEVYKDATIGKEHSIAAYVAGLKAGRAREQNNIIRV